MTRKLIVIIFLFLMFPFFVSAYTKEDIIRMVENQKLGDQETENLYNQYFDLYSRLIETRELDEETINIVYENVKIAMDTVKKYDIKTIDDLSKMPEQEKKKLHDNLYDTSKLIIKAPSSSNNKTSIKYNDDDTIDIYENGEHLDRISLKRSTFNYVGVSKNFVMFKYILPSLLLVLIVCIFITRKKELINNVLIIFGVAMLFINVFYFTIGETIYDGYNMVKSLNTPVSKTINSIVVSDKKIVKKPSYGSQIGNLVIENVGIDLPFYYGETKEILKKGLSLASSFPGFDGTSIMSGHNSDLFLNALKDVKLNDKIIIRTTYGNFKYKITKMEIKKENEYSSLIKNNKSLILYTCYPFDEIIYSNERFVVYADLIEEDWLYD